MSGGSMYSAALLYCAELPGDEVELAIKALPEHLRDEAYNALGDVSITSDDNAYPTTYYLGIPILVQEEVVSIRDMQTLATELYIFNHRLYLTKLTDVIQGWRDLHPDIFRDLPAWHAFLDWLATKLDSDTWGWRLIASGPVDV